MKNTFKKTLSLILASLMLLSTLASCASDTSEETASDTTVSTAEEEEIVVEAETEEELKTSVPEDLDYNGENVTLYYYKCLSTYNIEQEEMTGENVVDAIYKANMNTMDYLNCTFSYFNDTNMEMTNIKNSVTAGDGAYDICYATQWKAAPALSQHIFNSFTDAEYIDFDMPWWYSDYMNESSIGNGDIYMLAGDLNLTVLRRSSVMLMNNDLLNELNLDPDGVKSSVLEGAWTLDKEYDITNQIYIDVNGDGAKDDGDTYGIACWTRSDVEHIIIDAGIRATTRNENGDPELSLNSEQTVSCVEKVVRLFWEDNGMYYVEGVDSTKMLSENRVAFLNIKFSNLEDMREVETDYMIIPMPKLDETVENYSALVHDDVTVVCEPITCQNPSMVSAVIEQLAYEGYKNVIPEYYEVSLKNKYTRSMDDDNVKIIDTIHDNITTEFSYVYNYALNSIICNMRDIGLNSDFTFASYYAKAEKATNKMLEKFIKSMNEE